MLNTLFSNPLVFLIYAVALLTGLTIHEAAHAWTADRLGDPTARLNGRMKLNPLVHIDLTGLLFMLFFGFGWGKPVMFDPYNLKNPRQDAALISLAGPLANLVLSLVLALMLRLINLAHLPLLVTLGNFLFIPTIIFNVSLGVFNLLPISPLDGFKIVGGLLPRKKAEEWYRLERYGLLFLLLMVLPLGQTSMLESIMRPVVNLINGVLIPSLSHSPIVFKSWSGAWSSGGSSSG